MEVSTSFCTQAVSFKYGSFQDSDDSMREDEIYRMGSYNSQGYYNDGTHLLDGSIGEEEETSSSGSNEQMDFEVAAEDEEMLSEIYEVESEMSSIEEEEEEDEEDNDEWTNQKRADTDTNQNSVAYYAAMEMLRIRFPFQSIAIRISDFCCLQEKDLLNDTMIDFYLNHLVEHILPDNKGGKVTVLPAIFWHNLSLRQNAVDPEDAKFMSETEKMNLKFGDLYDFVADFDLQDFDYIVIPVNEWEHWTLAIVCNPYTANTRTIMFDSQLNADLNNLTNVGNLIEMFMKYAYFKRTGNQWTIPITNVLPHNLPQQDNNFDCGLFISEFAKRFLLNPPKELANFDFSHEYPDFSVTSKRDEMQKVVLSLSTNRARWHPLVELLNGYNTAAPHRAL